MAEGFRFYTFLAIVVGANRSLLQMNHRAVSYDYESTCSLYGNAARWLVLWGSLASSILRGIIMSHRALSSKSLLLFGWLACQLYSVRRLDSTHGESYSDFLLRSIFVFYSNIDLESDTSFQYKIMQDSKVFKY